MESWMPSARWVFVLAPLTPLKHQQNVVIGLKSRHVLTMVFLIPDVALVELPPQNADLSSSTTLPPHSITVLAAAIPDRKKENARRPSIVIYW